MSKQKPLINSSSTTHEHSYRKDKKSSRNSKTCSSAKSLKRMSKLEISPKVGIISPNFKIDSSLSSSVLDEIEIFQNQKIKEFKLTLEKSGKNHIPPYIERKREKIKELNQQAEFKRLEIMRKKDEEELARLEKSRELKIKSIQENYQIKREKIKNKEKLIEKVMKTKEDKDKHKEQNKKKEILMDNIKNYYSDKIKELKEKIDLEKYRNQLVRSEQKKIDSVLKKIKDDNL